jgi:hypothetical protein
MQALRERAVEIKASVERKAIAAALGERAVEIKLRSVEREATAAA